MILRRTVEAFLAHPEIDLVQVLIHTDDRVLYNTALAGLSILSPLPGGAARQESVRLGLEGLAVHAPANVLIHDAVRPFVSPALISAVLAALVDHHGAMAGLPLSDTLKSCEGGMVTQTIDRRQLFRAQTPQGFRFEDILNAHRNAFVKTPDIDFTDDAMVAEHAGLSVALVPGAEQNFKITTPEDLQRASLYVQQYNLEV